MVWRAVKDTVNRLLGSNPRVPTKPGSDGNNEETRISSSSEATLQAFLKNALELTFKDKESRSGAQQTLAAATLTTTKEKVENKEPIDALTFFSQIAPGPVDKYGVEDTFKRTYLIWPPEALDALLDSMLGMTSETDPNKTGNHMVKAAANTEGTEPEVFDAFHKALVYFSMRLLFRKGIFDIPFSNMLTAEDVDRLYTIGYIKNKVDFVIGRNMLAHGALQRYCRQNGKAMSGGKVPAPRRCWTISAKSKRPTLLQIIYFTLRMERLRFDEMKESCKTSAEILLPAALRPRACDRWVWHQIFRFGRFGMKKKGCSDEDVKELIRIHDPTYIPPSKPESTTETSESNESNDTPLSELFDTWIGEGTTPAVVDAHIAELAAAAAEALNDDAPIEHVPSVPVLTDRASALHPASSPQSSAISKGKKQASPSNDASEDGPCHRTRARLTKSESSSSDATSPCAERAQHHQLPKPSRTTKPKQKPTISAKAQGKKRVRDEEAESSADDGSAKAQGKKRAREEDAESSAGDEDGLSPTKRHRRESGSIALSPGPSTSGQVDAGQAPQIAPIANAPTPLPLQRHGRMLIDYERKMFTEIPVSDIRRGHGMTFPGGDEDNTEPPFTPQQVPIRTVLESDLELTKNWHILRAGLATIRRGGKEVDIMRAYSPFKQIDNHNSRAVN
ncbi:hypothetical protein EW145_g3025 [Phellinidium pouzarii]|uniref:Uncharacterized protein n=1 Tax=Phellinidium pouzarii TaxID=167371 RepID=A0A4S4LAK4_9AGAM|nr:hypothetical protein EW145_g3025 [Phellinidium pouzarii]